MKNYKILLGIHEIAGYYNGLESEFKSFGLKADFVTLQDHRFLYAQPKTTPFLISLWRKSANLRSKTPKSQFFIKSFYVIFNNLLRAIMVLRAVMFYDVIIFSYGITFTDSSLELLFYNIFNIKTIFVFHGTDCRPPYLSGKYCHTDTKINYSIIKKNTRAQKIKIKKIEKYSSIIINHLPQAQLTQKKFINFLIMGLPANIKPVTNQAKKITSKNKIKILHCPSDQNIKGSHEIKTIINNLKERGFKIEFILLTNVPHSEVLKQIQECDFIIDQMYSCTPMPGLVFEGAYFGKPSVIGGYFYNQIHNFLEKEDIPPSLYVHPKKLEDAIEKMVVDEDYRKELGEKANRFITEKWNTTQVAKRFLRLMSGDIPTKWWCNPNTSEYVHGGFPDWRTKEIIRNMIDKFGIESLELGHNPKLEKSFHEFSLTQSNK